MTRYAERQDHIRTAYSNRSLAKGRKGRTANQSELSAEQKAYQQRFRSTPPIAKQCVIEDLNGNYPDYLWTRPDA